MRGSDQTTKRVAKLRERDTAIMAHYYYPFSFCLFCLILSFHDGQVEGKKEILTKYEEELVPRPPLSTVPDAATQAVQRNFISATLGSNMVLQRDQKGATLWGYTTPGATVVTRLYGADDDATTTEPRLVFMTIAAHDEDGLWRQTLPPQPASLKPTKIHVKSASGEEQTLDNVLFGDVYICGGQSNMQFALPGNTNGTQEAMNGEHYPHVRVFSVGQDTKSSTPLPDLQTVEQKWSVASNTSLYYAEGKVKYPQFTYFSAVCWFFGQQVADGLNNQVPIGLISNDWGGTAVELWQTGGYLYNAMIYPYTIGPMAFTGFTVSNFAVSFPPAFSRNECALTLDSSANPNSGIKEKPTRTIKPLPTNMLSTSRP